MGPRLAMAVLLLAWPDFVAGHGPNASVPIRLTVAPDLPRSVPPLLIGEATSIWARVGVVLAWDSPAAASSPGLRVLVVHRAAPRVDDGEWPVGELVMARQTVPGGGSHEVPIAFVSIEAAEEILLNAALGPEPAFRTQQRLAVILGRAVAHEIGHYLLNTPSHAASGLMRARIDASSFADLRDGAFFLDRTAVQWLAAVPPASPGEPATRFSYTQH